MAYILNKTPILRRSTFYKNIISGSINKNTLVNHEHLTNKTNPMAEKRFKLKDNISDGYRLIYREHSVVNIVVAGAYHIGWIGLVAGTFSLGYLIYKNPPVREEGTEGILHSGRVLRPLTALERVFMLFASFTVSIILIVISKTIPFRIYHNSTEKVYKAVFVNRIFSKKQMETFSEGSAVPVFNQYLGDILFNINGRIVLLDKECFPVPNIRERMIRKKTV